MLWWPEIDRDLEAIVNGSVVCQHNASAIPAYHVPLHVPEQACERIHIDHALPVKCHMLLIIV